MRTQKCTVRLPNFELGLGILYAFRVPEPQRQHLIMHPEIHTFLSKHFIAIKLKHLKSL